MQIDLNGDVGESFGAYEIGHDAALIPVLTSANVACGFHAGDPGVMRATVALAREHGTAVGAHPGFPDLAGFGRREMNVSADDAEHLVLYQIAAVAGVAAADGIKLQHVKPHGALFNMAMRDATLAAAVARAVAAFERSLIVFGLPGSELLKAARAEGLRAVAEVFADRAYEDDGNLVSRKKPGAVLHDPKAIADRVVRMVQDDAVVSVTGKVIKMRTDTVCIHGDTPGAVDIARGVRQALKDAGIMVVPFRTN